MAWITLEYELEYHLVPDTEPGHVLEQTCFCKPELEQKSEYHGRVIVIHRDEADRIWDAS